jgi:ferredoxin
MEMRLLLKFDSKTIKVPVISRATLETGALINILRDTVGARKGEIIIEVEDDKVQEVEKIIEELGVEVAELVGAITKDEERCVHCGACISICPTEVFTFNGEKKVIVEAEKCIHCGACVKVCPTEALSLPE